MHRSGPAHTPRPATTTTARGDIGTSRGALQVDGYADVKTLHGLSASDIGQAISSGCESRRLQRTKWRARTKSPIHTVCATAQRDRSDEIANIDCCRLAELYVGEGRRHAVPKAPVRRPAVSSTPSIIVPATTPFWRASQVEPNRSQCRRAVKATSPRRGNPMGQEVSQVLAQRMTTCL